MIACNVGTRRRAVKNGCEITRVVAAGTRRDTRGGRFGVPKPGAARASCRGPRRSPMIGIKVALFGIAVVCASLALGRVLLSVFRLARGRPDAPWRTLAALGFPALAAAALSSSIWVVPEGFAGIRIHA